MKTLRAANLTLAFLLELAMLAAFCVAGYAATNILWLRLQRAAHCIQRGASLTEAAHAGGFTDSAHLSHAFRRSFGLTPSEVVGVVDWVLPPPE